MGQGHVIFLVNLIQDVNIIRPLVFLAARDLGLATEIHISRAFKKRDKSGVWQRELQEIGYSTSTPILSFETTIDALKLLEGKGGCLVAAAESNLSAHNVTHDIFRAAPPSFVTFTVQHGFEGVGILQNREHDLAHGRGVTFAADVVCGWMEGERLTSMLPSQRSKLHVTGSPALLQMNYREPEETRAGNGLVCENLHSVRLNVSGDFKTSFMDVFNGFCGALADEERSVTLRPHPGGQYVLKNKVPLPENVQLNNAPIYKVDLTQFTYGISAPSSVLIDMVLAGIPVGVWRDASGRMDAGNYDGLTELSTLSDWLDFSREAEAHPERFLEKQAQFLERQMMVTEPEEVHRRFAQLFQAAARMSARNRAQERLLIVANGNLPTLQLSFVKPLSPLVKQGKVEIDLLTEAEMKEREKADTAGIPREEWITRRLSDFDPTTIVFCRYSGPCADTVLDWGARKQVPTLYHIDDDLLNVPIELGEKKHAYHNAAHRLQTVRTLLDNTDLVYCSTARLKERLHSLGTKAPISAGHIVCASNVVVPATERPVRKVGYMGFEHAHDFQVALPALIKFLRQNPTIEFELFGSIPKPDSLNEFGDRIKLVPPVREYGEFLSAFAAREWDIGLCPLAPMQFNLMKANVKWVEYTATGVAVIASRGMVYDECCADGCGLLVGDEAEWFDALQTLTADPAARYAQVQRAQRKLSMEYSVDALREQVLEKFRQARDLNREIREPEKVLLEAGA